jgi:biotin transport system substrate-specific component
MNSKSTAKAYSSKLVLTYLKNAELFWILSFSVLTAIAAQISIPTQPVPFTLQTLVVLLAGAFLGPINGALSMMLYLLAGAFGLPVFANFAGGFPHLFGPTGGYLLAFPVAAYLVGLAVEKRGNFISVAASMIVALAIILFFGAFYLSYFVGNDIKTAMIIGAQTFTVWALAKVAVALAVYFSLPEKFRRLP